MSYTAQFRVMLPYPGDREEALCIARRLGERCAPESAVVRAHDPTEAPALLPLTKQHPFGIVINSWLPMPVTLPRVLARGDCEYADVLLQHAPDRASTLVLKHRAPGVAAPSLVLSGSGASEEVAAFVHARINLLRKIDALHADAAFDARSITGPRFDVYLPLAEDGFAKLVDAPEFSVGCDHWTLSARVDASRGAELAESLQLGDYSELDLHPNVGDDAAFASILELSRRMDLELRWEHCRRPWIHCQIGDGEWRNDGWIGAIELDAGPERLSLTIATILDHAVRESAAEWLAKRAEAPVVYMPPG
jgi:hypothetical protein